MRRRRRRTPRLDFIVIGAQKAGTTSLWRYLEDNPWLRMPPQKEASFFSEPGYPHLLRDYLRNLFIDAPRSATLGTVTPVYMLGVPGVPVEAIAQRIHETAPRVKLVALLRDPVQRAISAHRMAVRDYGEPRTFAEAVAAQLERAALEAARERGPAFVDSYVAGGEYGRILEAYRDRFGEDRLHVEPTDDLERFPAEVIRRVCEAIGGAPHEPAQLGKRFFASGEALLPPEAETDLRAYLDRHVWPHVRGAPARREAFDFWFRLWNTRPGPAPERVEDQMEARLRRHYAADTKLLVGITGIEPPWLAG